MRQKFIIGNWKMYTNAAEAERLAKAVAVGVGKEDRVCVAVCPPFPCLALDLPDALPTGGVAAPPKGKV